MEKDSLSLEDLMKDIDDFIPKIESNIEKTISGYRNYNNTPQFLNPLNSLFNDLVAFIKTNKTLIGKIHDKYLLNPKQIIEFSEIAKRTSEEAKKISQEALKIAQETSGVAPAAAQQRYFRAVAKNLEKPISRWFWSTIIMFGITLMIPMITTYFAPELLDIISKNKSEKFDYYLSLFIVTKIILTFLLTSITYWCSRMYKFYLNLQRVYEDKVVLIKSYIAYINSVDGNDESKKKIKEKIIDVIFNNVSISPSGISNSDATKFLDLLKR